MRRDLAEQSPQVYIEVYDLVWVINFNIWPKKCTEWTPGRKRKRGRPTRRWRDDIEKAAAVNWMSETENRMTWILERPSASSGLNG